MPRGLFVYRYSAQLGPAKRYEIRRSMIAGLGLGLATFVEFCMFAITFWYGAKLVREVEGFTPASWLVVCILLLIYIFHGQSTA